MSAFYINMLQKPKEQYIIYDIDGRIYNIFTDKLKALKRSIEYNKKDKVFVKKEIISYDDNRINNGKNI